MYKGIVWLRLYQEIGRLGREISLLEVSLKQYVNADSSKTAIKLCAQPHFPKAFINEKF